MSHKSVTILDKNSQHYNQIAENELLQVLT